MSEKKETTIDLALITPCKFNPRKAFDKDRLKELEDSIRKQGVLQAILVRPLGSVSKTADMHYEIICGERRFRAATAAGLKEIPARVVEMDDKTALEVQVIENQQRADLHPLEEAEGYELLMKKHKVTADDIAAKVGKSKPYVYQRLKLCELVPDCRKMFYDNKLTASTALLIARLPRDVQVKAAKDITTGYDGILSLQRAHARIQGNYMLELKDAVFAKDDKVCPERGSCATCPKRTSNQELLFSDIKTGDRCTDAACFNAKSKQYGHMQLEKAKKTGATIVKTEDAFPHAYSDDLSGGYVDLKDSCHEAAGSKKYGELLKRVKTLKPSVTIDKHGDVIEIVKKSEALKAFKDAGIKIAENGSTRDPKELAKQKVENRVREARNCFWVSKVSTAADQRCMNAIVLNEMLDHINFEAAHRILGKKYSMGMGAEWEIPELYELGDKTLQELIIKSAQERSKSLFDEDLEFLSGKLGFTVAKDYMITKEYLNAMTKDDLQSLIKELGVKAEFSSDPKKNLLVEVIMKNAPKGRVPAELAPKAKERNDQADCRLS